MSKEKVHVYMKIWDVVTDIVKDKKGTCHLDAEFNDEFKLFMMQRFLSMYSPSLAFLLNMTSNKFYMAFNEEEANQYWYKFFVAVVPKFEHAKAKYIRKIKTDNSMKEFYRTVASNCEMSSREVEMYATTFGLDMKDLKKQVDSLKDES